MKALVAPLVMFSSLSLLASGCGVDESDDLTVSDEALLTCNGWHHNMSAHHGHHHHRHHHGHGNGGSTGAGGAGGQNHLPAGNGGSMGGSTGTAGSGMGGSTGTAGSGGGMVDPRCTQVTGIVSWWHGDGDYDDAVGSNDGTTGGAAAFAPGIDHEAFSLSGATNSFVEVPDDASLQMTSAITIDAWINPSAGGGRIVDKITAFFSDGYLLDMAGDQIRMIIGQNGLIAAPVIPDGIFTHVAGVYDGATLTIYINGVQAAQGPGNGAPIPTSTQKLRIGADSLGGCLFSGMIDEPRVFNRALTGDEVAQLYTQTLVCQ